MKYTVKILHIFKFNHDKHMFHILNRALFFGISTSKAETFLPLASQWGITPPYSVPTPDGCFYPQGVSAFIFSKVSSKKWGIELCDEYFLKSF